jgi:hypothetical protein
MRFAQPAPEARPVWLRALFPDVLARRLADRAVDALGEEVTLREAVDAWEEAYFRAAGHSPFRRPGKRV